MKKKQLYFDEEEKALIDVYENGETEPVKNFKEMTSQATSTAKNYLDKIKASL